MARRSLRFCISSFSWRRETRDEGDEGDADDLLTLSSLLGGVEVERGVEAERVAAVVLDMVVADEDEVVDELLLILCVCVCVC